MSQQINTATKVSVSRSPFTSPITGRRQKGMTAMGIILVLAMVAFFVFIALKLWPVYYESFGVSGSLDSLSKESGLGGKPVREIMQSLTKKLKVNDVTSVTKEDISLEKTSTGTIVYVEYEVEKPLFGNISIVVYFDKQAELPK